MRNECARREADHERIVSSIKREAESAGRLARDEVQHQNAEALHSAQKQLEALTAERDAANSALQAAEENTERITKQAAARNSQVNMTLKSKDMELAQLRAEQQRLQDLLTSSEDFQALLQIQLVSSREQKHSEAFDMQRQALCEARKQISLLSPEVHNLREQVNKLNAEILAQKTIHEQALSEHSIERHRLIFECEQRRQGEARLNTAGLEASQRRLQGAHERIKELEEQAEEALRQRAHLELSLSNENDLLRQRLSSIGSEGLLFQVSPSKDVRQMEDELDRLRGENFNLRIRIGDLESDCANGAKGLGAGARAQAGGAGAGAGVRGGGDRVGVLATRESAPQCLHRGGGGGGGGGGGRRRRADSIPSPPEKHEAVSGAVRSEDAHEFARSLSLARARARARARSLALSLSRSLALSLSRSLPVSLSLSPSLPPSGGGKGE